MKSPRTRPSFEPEGLARDPLQEAISASLPLGTEPLLADHRDYDGRGLKIQPLDHLDGDSDAQRFVIR
jgi:hypothetical protein